MYCLRCTRGVDPRQCVKCSIFSSSLIHRHQLEALPLQDLRYYFEDNNLVVPIPESKALYVEEILVNQAKELSQRALESQDFLRDPSVLGKLNFLPRNETPSTSGSHYASSGVGPKDEKRSGTDKTSSRIRSVR